MNPIELTDLHKSKLLEMCKVLFTKYYHFGFYSMQSNMLQISETKDSLVLIHWFEFCMTKLVDKLYNSINYTDSDEFNINLHVEMMLDMVNFKINPIDTLYKEFLKTKINNK